MKEQEGRTLGRESLSSQYSPEEACVREAREAWPCLVTRWEHPKESVVGVSAVTLEGEGAEGCLLAYFLAPGSLDGKHEQYTSLINAKPQSPFSIRTCL